MFFLLRCAFWLGLTFSLMTWPDGGVQAPDTAALARAAAGQAASACAAHVQTCLDTARKIDTLRNAVESPAPARRSGADATLGTRGRS